MTCARDFKAREQHGEDRDMEKDLKTELQAKYVRKCQSAAAKHWGLLLGAF